MILLDTQGGVLKGASPGLTERYLVVRYLFLEWLGGGGRRVGFLPWGFYYCAAGRASGTKRSIVIAHLVTISSSPGSDSAPEESTNLAAVSMVA